MLHEDGCSHSQLAQTKSRAPGAAQGIAENQSSPQSPKILPSPRGVGAGSSCSKSLGAWGWPSPSLWLPAAAAFGESIVLVALKEQRELSNCHPSRNLRAQRGSEHERQHTTALPSTNCRCLKSRCVYLAFSMALSRRKSTLLLSAGGDC